MSVLVVFITLPLILSALLLPVSHCQPSDTSYRLVWSEEFNYANGAQPSSAIWNWETGAGGWGNNELEFYTERPVNSYINNSALVIQANAESYYGSPYTSARINTAGKVEVYQGYVAARARISMANGFWPAVWMLGSAAQGWPWCGEVDFMEQVNGQSASPNADDHTQYGTLHYDSAGINDPNSTYTVTHQGASITTDSTATLWGDDWHVYAFEWTATAVTVSVDSVVYGTVCTTCSVGTNAWTNSSNPFYFIVNLAIGGDFPGVAPDAASMPGRLLVDWIRVWQKDDGVSFVNAPATSPLSSSSSTATAAGGAASSSTSRSSAASTSSSRPSSSSTRSSSSSRSSSSTTTAAAPTASNNAPVTLTDWSPSDKSYSLAWHEEFAYSDGTQPSASMWNWETGGSGWGNRELEYYTARPVNSYISNGTLIVAGLWETYNGNTITSARMTTDRKVLIYQGVVAARVRVTGMQNGYWPSVWMMGNKSDTLGWPWCGEIDIHEQVNGYSAPGTPSDDHYQHGTIHYNLGGQSAATSTPTQRTSVISTNNAAVLWGDDWHVYAVEWTASTISFIVDSTVYSSMDISSGIDFDAFRDPHNPYYVLIDFAFGGNFPNVSPNQSAFPARMEVDWLRAYQQPGGTSYVVAPASSLVGLNASSSSSTAAAFTTAASSSTASFSESSGSSVPGFDSSSGGNTVHTNGERLRSFGSRVWCVSAVMLLIAMLV